MLRGINYDVGTQTGPYLSRPTFEAERVREDLRVIREELHCEAVRISGTSKERLLSAAELALGHGLRVWLSPQLHDHGPEETLANLRECAAAADDLAVTYLLGTELTLMMRGIMRGDTLFDRLRPHRMLQLKYLGRHNKPLNDFLARAAREVRKVFSGPLGYAAAPIEGVDWEPFDLVCLDYYRGERNRLDYGQRLRRHFAHGKPVYVTELGCCAYQGAELRGGMAWSIVDRRDHDRLDAEYVRDEQLQADEVLDMLRIVEREGVAGAFVFTFATPALPHRPEPRRDLDLASYGLVACDESGGWRPKRLFHALAEHYARPRAA